MRTTKKVKTFSIDLTMGLPSCLDGAIGWWAHREPSPGRRVGVRVAGRDATRPRACWAHGVERYWEALAPIAVRDHAL
jgi:hypothetical protein